MKTSAEYRKVFEAVAQARSKMPAIIMDANNPYFKSKYASLGEILRTIQPTLDEHKLGIVSTLEGDGVGCVGITTRIVHTESGEWIESSAMVPLKGGSDKTQVVQVAGIDFSYLRRYTINAMFNLYAEEDTDGNLGYERPAKQVRRPEKPSRPVKATKRNDPKEEVEEADEAEDAEENKLEDYIEEFTHLYNKARALGNEKENLPAPGKNPTETEMLEKIAEISLIIKESEEGEE